MARGKAAPAGTRARSGPGAPARAAGADIVSRTISTIAEIRRSADAQLNKALDAAIGGSTHHIDVIAGREEIHNEAPSDLIEMALWAHAAGRADEATDLLERAREHARVWAELVRESADGPRALGAGERLAGALWLVDHLGDLIADPFELDKEVARAAPRERVAGERRAINKALWEAATRLARDGDVTNLRELLAAVMGIGAVRGMDDERMDRFVRLLRAGDILHGASAGGLGRGAGLGPERIDGTVARAAAGDDRDERRLRVMYELSGPAREIAHAREFGAAFPWNVRDLHPDGLQRHLRLWRASPSRKNELRLHGTLNESKRLCAVLEDTPFRVRRRVVRTPWRPSEMQYEIRADGVIDGEPLALSVTAKLAISKRRLPERQWADAQKALTDAGLSVDAHGLWYRSENLCGPPAPDAGAPPAFGLDDLTPAAPCAHQTSAWSRSGIRRALVCAACAAELDHAFPSALPGYRRAVDADELRRQAERELPFHRAIAALDGRPLPSLAQVMSGSLRSRDDPEPSAGARRGAAAALSRR